AEAGLGAGWQEDELHATGQRYPDGPTRAAMYREAIEIVRDLLRTGTSTFDGDHYNMRVPALGPKSPSPPQLVAAVGGAWTIRHVTPLVDRVELKIGRSTRGGRLDWSALGSVSVDEVRMMVERVREVRADVPVGLLVFVAVGTDQRIRDLEERLGDGLFGTFVGESRKVAGSIRALAEVGIDRIHVQEWTKGSIPALAADLLEPRASEE
ncbi:MAG: LLM class flavin-dependent oxidoreductase, partial [Ilumatobacteraceae bacterium]